MKETWVSVSRRQLGPPDEGDLIWGVLYYTKIFKHPRIVWAMSREEAESIAFIRMQNTRHPDCYVILLASTIRR